MRLDWFRRETTLERFWSIWKAKCSRRMWNTGISCI